MIPAPLLELLRADTAALREQGLELLRLQRGDVEAVAALLEQDLLAPDVPLGGARLPGVVLAGQDLALAELSGADLRGADLQRAILRQARLSGARLDGADLRGADLSAAELSGAHLSGADLRDADLHAAQAEGLHLQGALCSPQTRLPVTLPATPPGVLLLCSGGRLPGAALPGLEAPAQVLRGIVLRGADLSGADLHDADLRGADLREADLRGAVLSGASLIYSDLRGADLRDADLRGADLRCADLAGARLEGALRAPAPPRPPPRAVPSAPTLPIQIVGLRAPHLDLRELLLCRASLPEADLRGADLRGAVLEDVDLSGADLRGASLAGAVLRRVQLGGARLEGADLRWTAVEETFLPAGLAGPQPLVAGALPPAFPRSAAEEALRTRGAPALWSLVRQLRPREPYRELLAATAAWLEASGPPRTPESDPGWLSRRTGAISPSFHHRARRAQVARLREGSVGWLDVWVRQALAQVWEEVLPPIGALRWVATGGLLSRPPETALRPWSPAHPLLLLAGPPDLPRFPEDAQQLPHGTEGLGPGVVQARCWVWGGLWSHLDIRAGLSATNQEALLHSPQGVALETLRLPSPAALYPLVRARGTALPNLRSLIVLIQEPGTHVIPDLSAAAPSLERLEILRAPDVPGARGLTRVDIARMRLPRLHHLAVRPLEPPRGSASSHAPPQIHSLRIGEVDLPALLTVDILAERLTGLHRVRPQD